jgi:hypothetical protein
MAKNLTDRADADHDRNGFPTIHLDHRQASEAGVAYDKRRDVCPFHHSAGEAPVAGLSIGGRVVAMVLIDDLLLSDAHGVLLGRP